MLVTIRTTHLHASEKTSAPVISTLRRLTCPRITTEKGGTTTDLKLPAVDLSVALDIKSRVEIYRVKNICVGGLRYRGGGGGTHPLRAVLKEGVDGAETASVGSEFQALWFDMTFKTSHLSLSLSLFLSLSLSVFCSLSVDGCGLTLPICYRHGGLVVKASAS